MPSCWWHQGDRLPARRAGTLAHAKYAQTGSAGICSSLTSAQTGRVKLTGRPGGRDSESAHGWHLLRWGTRLMSLPSAGVKCGTHPARSDRRQYELKCDREAGELAANSHQHSCGGGRPQTRTQVTIRCSRGRQKGWPYRADTPDTTWRTPLCWRSGLGAGENRHFPRARAAVTTRLAQN